MEWFYMNVKKISCSVVWAFMLLSLVVRFVPSAAAAELHTLEFAAPPAVDQRLYLGINADTFKLADVQADIIIVEFFSLYCAMCAKEAPAVAELFSLAKKQSTPQLRIVLLGIGAGNTADEVARFQKQHTVLFPLVPDQKVIAMRSMKMAITPGFIAFKKQPDGSLVSLHTRVGVLGPPQRFLDSALQAAAALP
jgi:peroxiredoxin